MSSDRWADVEQIKILKARYFRHTDEKSWADLRSLFVDDFVYTDDAKDLEVEGADAFMEFLLSRHENSLSVHHGFMPEIELTGPDEAVGVWSMTDVIRIPTADGMLVQHGHGHYHETYRRGETWQIARMRLTRLWISVGTETRPPVA